MLDKGEIDAAYGLRRATMKLHDIEISTATAARPSKAIRG